MKMEKIYIYCTKVIMDAELITQENCYFFFIQSVSLTVGINCWHNRDYMAHYSFRSTRSATYCLLNASSIKILHSIKRICCGIWNQLIQHIQLIMPAPSLKWYFYYLVLIYVFILTSFLYFFFNVSYFYHLCD